MMDRRSFLMSGAAAVAATRVSGAPSIDETDPLGVRGDFPITRTRTYLNSAYAGPLSNAVRQAASEFTEDRTFHPSPGRGQEKADSARVKFASLFGTKPEEVGLLYATSDGENVIARALNLAPGDNVVMDELHFITSFVLYRQLEKEKGIELRVVPHKDGRVRVEDVGARVDKKTRLISVAWVSNRNGYRQDVRGLASLAHSRGAFLYVDAIQALGAFPASLTEEGVDFLTTGAFKWLFASFGVAPFYVRQEHLDRIAPDRYGHSQVAEELPENRFRLHATARKFEYAALANGPVYELDAALGYLQRVGLDRIEKHGVALARDLRDGVAALGFRVLTPPENRSPIVTFVHGREPDAIKRLLDREGIDVTFREKGTQIRASVALFNNRDDVGRLLKALGRVA